MFSFKKIKNLFLRKKIISVIFLSLIFIFLYYNITFAQNTVDTTDPSISGGVAAAVNLLLALIAYVITAAFGALATVLISIIVNVAQFSDIINIPSVSLGWTIIRDICNMFFILILLVIAFATILRKEEYSAKSLLPKLLIAAVLINFSKTIFGLIIDFSQVVMLTFVAAFAQNGAANFINAFNIQSWWGGDVKSVTGETTGLDSWTTTMAIIGGMVASVVTLIVLIIMLAVLVIRIVMLWIYTILSPLVFLGQGFPPIKKFTSNIWEDFIKNVVVGPILAFFIWLALVIGAMGSIEVNKNLSGGVGDGNFVGKCGSNLSSFFCNTDFQKFIIIIGLLCGGLLVTQKMGGAIGALGGKGLAWAKKAGMAPLKIGKNIAGWGVDKISDKAKIDFNVFRGVKRMNAQFEKNKAERENKVYESVTEGIEQGNVITSNLALLSSGNLAVEAYRNIYKNKFAIGKTLLRGGKGFNEKSEKLNNELNGFETERKNVISSKERGLLNKKLKENYVTLRGDDKKKGLDQQIREQEQIVKDQPNQENIKKLGDLKEKRNDIKKTITELKNKQRMPVDDKKVTELGENIEKKKQEIKNLKTGKLPGLTAARAESFAQLESEGGKIIAHIDNPMELASMFEDAISNQKTGLAAAIAKKMTKNSDYNELMNHLGFGTGLNGFKDFANLLSTKGGFSHDQAYKLIGDMGSIGKGINHYAAFGAVTMDKGKLRMSTDNEYEGAMLAELLKLQPQNFARNVNRLGLGYYEGGNHGIHNWKMSRAAIGYLKLNGQTLAKNYESSGQQNSIEHMFKYIKDLKNNNVPEPMVNIIITRSATEGAGANPKEFIKTINN